MPDKEALFRPLELPCGTVLKNRIVKSAMSDSLGDGQGQPTPEQIALYGRWAEGGVAAAIIGEVQGDPSYAEKPGNLVLDRSSDLSSFRLLAKAGNTNGAHLWLQLGQAGAMAYPPISTPKGPSALDLPGLACAELTLDEISALPSMFATTAKLSRDAGFGGVQVHAAHGFLLSQFLSPLFNQRTDGYGGGITNRMRLLLEVIEAVRDAVGPAFPIALKLNSSDLLEGGLEEEDALKVVEALDGTSIDLLDISGGTYFPGAKSASDGSGKGPYFLEFARRARALTAKPLMLTGGFKTLAQAADATSSGTVDVVGLARALALEPSLPVFWKSDKMPEPVFPKFRETPEGGVTAWYTMRLTDIGAGLQNVDANDLQGAIRTYEARDAERAEIWNRHFGTPAEE